VLCKTGSSCSADVSGVTLETLPLMPGYYRISNVSDDLRRCPDFGDSSGCVGGVGLGEGPCKEWLTGPYCRLCNVTDRSRYFSPDTSACLVCEGDAGAPFALGFGLFIATLAIVLLWVRFKPHRDVRWLAHGSFLGFRGCPPSSRSAPRASSYSASVSGHPLNLGGGGAAARLIR